MSLRTLRLFVAVYPPEASGRAMLAALDQAAPRVQAKFRPTPLEQIHMTVQFIGETRPNQLDEVLRSVERSVSGVGDFHLSPTGLLTLPHKGPPRLIAMQTDAPPALLEVHRRLALRLAKSPRARAAEGFLPHMTLCRFGGEARAQRIEQPVSLPSFQVNTVRIMRSVLKPQGAEHIPIADFPL